MSLIPSPSHSSSHLIQMNKDSLKAVVTAAATGCGLAAFAMHINQRKAKTGREPWNLKADSFEYDFIIKELVKAVYNFARWGTGPLSSQFTETVTFVHLMDIAPEFVTPEKAAGTCGPNVPHIKLMYCTSYFKFSIEGDFPSDTFYTITPMILNPASRGTVGATIRQSVKGQDGLWFDPVINPSMYSDAFDKRVMNEAIRFL